VTVLVLVLVYGAALGWLFDQYKQLNDERLKQADQFTERNKQLNEKELSLEKRELIVSQRETLADQREENLAAEATAIEQKERGNIRDLARLQQEEAALSRRAQQKRAEQDIERLMSEFSALGINLSERPNCSDVEEVRRYRSARAKYSEIVSIAEANGLGHKYQTFILENDPPGITPDCRND